MTRAKHGETLRLVARALLALADDVEDSKPIAPAPIVYTADPAGSPPPGKSRKWASRILKTLPNARKVGKYWEISVTDWNAWIASRQRARVAKTAIVPASIQDDVEAALEAGGVRLTKRSA